MSNLKPFKPGEIRAVENGKKGGLKTAEAKREKKQLKEVIKILLDIEPGEQKKKELLDKYKDINAEEITMRFLILEKQLQKALDGDLRATQFICEITGELPNEQDLKREPILPVFNIQVVDNKEVEKEFLKYM